MKPRWLLEAAGAALLLLLPDFSPLLLPRNIALYHHRLPMSHLVGGLLLDLLGAVAAGAVSIFLLYRLPALLRRVAGACAAAALCWRAAGVFSTLFALWSSNPGRASAAQGPDLNLTTALFWSRWAHFTGYGSVLLFAALALFAPAVAERAVRAVRFGLAALSFSFLWIVPALAAISLAHPAEVELARASLHPHKGAGRIVWILFDELSYDLLFDHHPPGLATPNFQRLYSASISLGDLEPTGFKTDRVVPSLLAGFQIDQIAGTSRGALLYLDEQDHQWKAYDPERTLFALAQSEGWNTGVAGWYIPYCRTFGPALNQCSWLPGIQRDLPLERDGASEYKSALANALVLPEAAFARLLSPSRGRAGLLGQNIRDYLQVMKNAQDLIDDPNIQFVFLHLPVPHPPGFYDRSSHQLSESGNYLDNLVLADDALGILRQQIARSQQAGQTTLIVSSDHSWRVPLWSTGRDWTAEERRVSQGRFDSRPVFLVHFPGQKNGADILTPTSELIEHAIVAGILSGSIKGPGDLRRHPLLSIQTAGAPATPAPRKPSF